MIKLVHFADLHLGVENYGRVDPACVAPDGKRRKR